MLNAQHEIERLMQHLRMRNISEQAALDICNEASRDISDAIFDAVTDAMNEAVNAGGDIMSIDFIDELRVSRFGGSFEITTDSGRTDFSEPPFPMLPKLLKNAKIAKDGSQYKVIPMKSKNSDSHDMAVTTEAAIQNINNARVLAKKEKEMTSSKSATLADVMQGSDMLTSIQSINNARQKHKAIKSNGSNGAIEFRTASSKQDPNTQWVNPGKKIDMSETIRNINNNMQAQIDNIISSVISRYSGMY